MLQIDQWGWSLCSIREYYNRDKLSLSPTFYYYDQELGDKVLFNQTMEKSIVRGMLVDIHARVTHSGVCILRGKPCSCQILGDGQKQHFGNQFPDYKPAYINVACKIVEETL